MGMRQQTKYPYLSSILNRAILTLAKLHLFVLLALPMSLMAAEPDPKPEIAAPIPTTERVAPGLERAVLAGGCFWCMEAAFDGIPGVVKVVSGYTGGALEDANYEKVSSGRTGHYEVVAVDFEPHRITYEQILTLFWQNINPTQGDGQFADRGKQYRTAVFYLSPEQERLARASKKALEESKKFELPIVTEILPGAAFYPAEEYHQGYHRKNKGAYERYKQGSGRADYIERVWKGK